MPKHRLLAAMLLPALHGPAALADPPARMGLPGTAPVWLPPALQPEMEAAPALPPPNAPVPRPWRRRPLPASPGGAASGVAVIVRSGNHPGFGRLTFDYPGGVAVGFEQNGDTLILRFDGAAPVNMADASLPRNVVALSASAHEVIIASSPGTRLRRENSGRQIVVDVLDASGAASPTDVAGAVASPPPPTSTPPSSPPLSSPPLTSSVGQTAPSVPERPPHEGAFAPAVSDPGRVVTAETLPPAAPPSGMTVRIPPMPYGEEVADAGASEPAAPAVTPSPASKPAIAVPVRPVVTPPPAAVPAKLTGATAPPAATSPAAPRATAPQPQPAAPSRQAVSPAAPIPPIASPAPVSPPMAAAPTILAAPVVIAPAAPETAPAAPPASAPAWAIPSNGTAVDSLRLVASRIPVPRESRGVAINLPFTSRTGAAALRRGENAVLVFDESRPIDVAGLRADPVFASATIQLLGNATVLRMRLPSTSDLRMAPVANGWNVWVGPIGDKLDSELQPMPIDVADQQLQFGAADASRSLIIPDTETGGNLLIGTQRKGGQAVVAARRTPDFIVLQSFQGVAIEPFSDRPQLNVAPPGLVLAGADRPLSLSNAAVGGSATAEASGLTRRVDLPALSDRMLAQRLKNRLDEAAATAPLARLPARRAVAEAMLALGMGPEAQGELRLAVADDPRGADDPDTLALGAMAAMVAHRPAAAGAINDKRLTGTDEIRLWRAIRQAELQYDAAEAVGLPGPAGQTARDIAVDLAATAPLVVAYPDLLRDELLPLVVETMVIGGQTGPAAALLAKRPEDTKLALARAFLARAQGDNAAALAGFDRLARGHDRLLHFRASMAAIELRLATGAMTAQQAADAGEKLLFAWRGDDRERSLRIELASWRFKAGQWRAALAMLRESAVMFPEQRDQFRHAMTETLRGLMRDDRVDGMDSVELISLLEENIDLLPDGPEGQAAAVRLADRMQLLDLDQRAEPVLERLAKTTPSLPARAAFGVRLAALRLEVGDAEGALAALAVSASDGLTPGLVERRMILGARADAASGRRDQAVAALTTLATPAADLARAGIEEAAKEWAGAAAAMAAYVAQNIPAAGALTPEQSHTILRLAADLAQAGDDAGLATLHTQQAERMANGPDAAAFRLLTESPVRDVSDLPRAAKEIAAAHAVAAPVR